MPNMPAVVAFEQAVQNMPPPSAQARGRIIFALDATASREQTWRMATKLQAEMFHAVGKDMTMQLVFFRGNAFGGADECKASRWVKGSADLEMLMKQVRTETGYTQIARVLKHAAAENRIQPVSAVVYVGDACEEHDEEVYGATRGLGCPVFMFHEDESMGAPDKMRSAPDRYAKKVFKTVASLTGGAYATFDEGSADEMKRLLRAVGRYASGKGVATT